MIENILGQWLFGLITMGAILTAPIWYPLMLIRERRAKINNARNQQSIQHGLSGGDEVNR